MELVLGSLSILCMVPQTGILNIQSAPSILLLSVNRNE